MLTVALASISVVWLAGVSVSLPCTGDPWNMDHSASEAVRPHGFGRSMVSFCLLGLHEEQKGRLREKWGGAMERGRIGLCRKVGLAWIGVGVGSRIGVHKNPLVFRLSLKSDRIV